MVEYFPFERYSWFSFEKRIYIPLPVTDDRKVMFKAHLGTSIDHALEKHELLQMVQESEQ